MKIGILCGHPLSNLLDKYESISVETSYGLTELLVGHIGKDQIFFINRHGNSSSLPPHRASYLANMEALSSSHVDYVLSVGTVGSMKPEIKPGDFVVPDDFFDATHSRPLTFFEDRRVHVDMTDPFCPLLRQSLITARSSLNTGNVHRTGVYVATQGPRLETAAEVRFFASVGDIVGMTLVPEVVLAREKGLCFASICLVCNMAAGLQSTLSVRDIKRIYAEKESMIASLLKITIRNLTAEKDCDCNEKSRDALL